MQISVVAVGTRMPAWVNDGVDTYRKRLPRHIELEFREISAAQRSGGRTPDQQIRKEGEAMLKAVPEHAYTIALDERGEMWSSRELAAHLESWMANHPRVALLIGGADGLSDQCRERAARAWSLSPLTLPHALVRVVLAEQLYRAWTLVQGHPYHRE